MFDVLIKGGRVFDGSGNPWFFGDIGIVEDTIKAVGRLNGACGKVEIRTGGLAVAPGFVDIHTHSDAQLLIQGEAHSHVRQGVTTDVIGHCGTSLAPITDALVEYYKKQRLADLPGLEIDWRTMGQYLAKLERLGVSINVVPLVGQGTVRGAVMGFEERPATPEELEKMRSLVREAMADGAFGLSTGLIYVPGCYAQPDEVLELVKTTAECGGVYCTHVRGEGDPLFEAYAEAIEAGAKAGISVEIAHCKVSGRHMWGVSTKSMGMLDEARAQGVEVTGDQYPYNAGGIGLGALVPPWAHIGGQAAYLKRLADPAAREKMKQEMINGVPGWSSVYKGLGWENALISACPDKSLESRTIAEVAKSRGKDDWDTAFDLLLEFKGRLGLVVSSIGDEDIERIMRHPAVMVGSDSSGLAIEGPLATGKPHPRAFGTYARVLGRYVREKKVLTLQEAIRKMTSMPAQKMRLFDRGLLRPGLKADIVVFNPDTIIDRATYANPFQYPVGVEHVFVNGQETVRKGEHLGTKAGKVLRMNRR